jgi:hypothetical protein
MICKICENPIRNFDFKWKLINGEYEKVCKGCQREETIRQLRLLSKEELIHIIIRGEFK